MHTKTSLFVLTLAAAFTSSAFPQTDFYWSPADLNEGSVNESLNIDIEIGETKTLYLYFTTQGPSMTEIDTGCFFDVSTSVGNAVDILEGETYDFDIVIDNIDISCRFGDAFGPGVVLEEGQLLQMNAFTHISGTGMLNSNTGPVFFDEGYDFSAAAFLVAELSIEATAIGTVELNTDSGSGGIVHDGIALDPVFGAATINVVDKALLGDINLDGFVTLLDAQPFNVLLATNGFQIEADMNQDGFVTLLDVAPFIDALQFP